MDVQKIVFMGTSHISTKTVFNRMCFISSLAKK